MPTIRQECEQTQDYIIAMRRALHKIPEVETFNPKTRAFLCEELTRLGIPWRESRQMCDGKPDTSLIALIEGKNADKVLALRSDTDALPQEELLDVPYRSEHPGCMHACGHDCHMAMLLGAAKILMAHREELNGSVKLLFQSGEENVKGSKLLIQDGCLENPKVSAILGFHVWPLPDLPVGTVVARPGCVMVSGTQFVIRIHGKGSHGSAPALGVDPITCAAQIITALQTITSRELPGDAPRVLSVCKMKAGTVFNVIPDDAELEGTIRTPDEQVQHFYMKRIEELARGIGAAMRCEVEVSFPTSAPPVINDEATAHLAAGAARKMLGDELLREEYPTNMATEDFANYEHHVPGAFMFLNISNSDPATQVSVHNGRFCPDESVLWHGTAVYVQAALDFLE